MCDKNPQVPKADSVSLSSVNSVPFAEVAPSHVETEMERLQRRVREATTKVDQAKSQLDEDKKKLEETYRSLDTSENEIESLIKEIESGKKTNKTLHKKYYDALTKWSQASQEREKAVEDLEKYQSNITAGIPEVMVFLKDFKEQMMNQVDKLERENEILKNQMQELKKDNKALKQNIEQQVRSDLATVKSDVQRIITALKEGLQGSEYRSVGGAAFYRKYSCPNI